tara:strand:- start:4755 stop:9650 length:4896 start_codon:yes stop_codon:yes gene_type:complete
MNIFHLNQEGLHRSEKDAVNKLERELPQGWHGFSSLEMFDRNAGSFETDLILLTHDRIIVVELKKWSGKIYSKGQNWVLDWGTRQETRKNPLKQVRRAAQILNTKLLKKLKGKIFNPFVDNCVVLCGSADKSSLPDDEKDFVFTVDEFIDICTTKKYSKFFNHPSEGYGHLVKKEDNKPYNNYKIFKNFFVNNSVDFKPKTFCVNNYAQTGNALFTHQDNIYSEYLAQRTDDANYKTLMRKWDFWAPSIAEKAQTPEEKSLIGYRESKVLGYIDNQDETLQDVHLELNYIPSPDDITSDFVELYKWPGNRLRLDEFMARKGSKLTDDGRLDIIKVLVSHLARLHDIDVAHRDIGKHSIWLSLPSKVTFSNFLTASYPDKDRQSVRTVRDILKSGRVEIPEDLYEDKDGTPFTRDVYLAGAVAHYIAYGTWPRKLDDGIYGWGKPDNSFKDALIDTWLECCLDIEAKNRFSNMSVALDELNRLLEKSNCNLTTASELEKYYSDINVYMTHMPTPIKQKSATSVLLRSQDEKTGICLWHGVSQFTADKRINVELATFLERVNSLKNSSLDNLASVQDFGYNPNMQSLFVTYEWIEGCTWDKWLDVCGDADSAKDKALLLLKSVTSFHRSQFIHGDIHPQNIVIRESNGVPVLIDLFEYQGPSTAEPYNTNYLPSNFEQIALVARDRYAIVKMIKEIATKFSLLHLKQYCSELMELQEISEGEIFRLIDGFNEIVDPKPLKQIKTYSVFTKFLPAFSHLEADDDTYYLTIKLDDRQDETILKVFISGVKQQLDLHIDPVNKVLKRAFPRDSISHHQFISHKRKSDAEIEGKISFSSGAALSADELIADILALKAVKIKLAERESKEKEAKQVSGSKRKVLSLKSVSQKVSSKSIWKALVETEDETLPKVLISKQPELLRNNEVIVRFSQENQNVDFDLNRERVNVKLDTGSKVVPIGRLLEVGKDTLRIGHVRNINFGPGDQLKLESSLSAASLAKRQKAIENILNDRAVIPDLVDYFDINQDMNARVLNDEPTNEELDLYNVFDDNGELKFTLNPQQRIAFKKLFKYGPVSLLQGPPGTGKTSFISSFIHFAATKGSSKILLVSQSHEAVNNAAEKVRKLFSEQDKEITVVRLGDEPNISAPLLDVHEIALQDHYRELFRAEFKTRLKDIVTPLALPEEFIDLAIEYESSFGIKISSLVKTVQHSDKETAEVLERRESLILTKLMSWIGRNGLDEERFKAVTTQDIKKVFYTEIANYFEVTSTDAVGRFQQVVDLSKEWLEVMSSRNAHFQNFLTKTRTLVCGTCVGIGRNHYGIGENIYDWVIIDEAARSSASEMAIAMQIGKRVLLVGDHKQLPPSYEEDHLLAAHRKLPEVKLEDLEQSDFERSFYSSYGKKVGQTLLTQYRMLKPIGELISKSFYDGKLETGKISACSVLDFNSMELKNSVTWLDTSFAMQDSYEKKPNYSNANIHSVINQYEANVIVNLIQSLINKTNIEKIFDEGSKDEAPIGVICMYAEQQKLMIRQMNSISWTRALLEKRLLKVDTVDSYQGKENDVIILSLVRNNSRFTEGFLSSEHRANVALSRAKERLFIVGAANMWADKNTDRAFGRVLNHIKNNNECELINSDVINKEGK